MSLVTVISDLATRIATECKALRTLINGNAADLTALTTTAKSNLVLAINEVNAASGGAMALDDLSDVVVASPAVGHILRHDGTDWDNVLGSTYFATPASVTAAIDALIASAPGALNTLDELAAALGDDANYAATVTTALAGKQPLDAGLTSISGLTTLADRSIYTTAMDTYAVYTLTAFGRSLAAAADAAAARTLIDVYSKAEVGDPATDFVATFNAGLV